MKVANIAIQGFMWLNVQIHPYIKTEYIRM